MCHCIATADVVEVKFDYDAQQPDQLTLHVGDNIRNCKLVEEGWLEGELNGKRGIFPGNFVVKKDITPPPGVMCVCVCIHETIYNYVFLYVCLQVHLHTYNMYVRTLCTCLCQ